jgi:hypothetical protein
MKAKTVIAKALMAFVLVSIGFAVGKEMTLRAMSQNNDGAQEAIVAASANPTDPMQDKVIVYYMHATFRCFTCNNIEAMAKEVVENDFADAMADGRVEWKAVNFQENVALGRRYGVGTATVVVVKIEGGREADFKRLDEVWTHVNNPPAFKRYIDENVQAFLDGGQG